jgi:hypothetical protein
MITLKDSRTLGGTTLDGRPTSRRDLYLTTHNTQNIHTPIPIAELETPILASERTQTYVLERAATAIGRQKYTLCQQVVFLFPVLSVTATRR